MQRRLQIIVEKHSDGYVAYPVGLKGIVVAQGESYEDALADVRSAIEFHIETFGPEVLEEDDRPRGPGRGRSRDRSASRGDRAGLRSHSAASPPVPFPHPT